MNLSSLNEAQKEAVVHTEGHIRVVAGAGSGKTRALAFRYAYIVNELGIPPSGILCLTFTNKAAQEMKGRIASLVPNGCVGDLICTIHGFCVKFLRKEIFRIGYPKNFLILDEEDNKSVIKEVLLENGIDRKTSTVENHQQELSEFKARTPYIPSFLLPGSVIPDECRSNLFVQMVLRQKQYLALDFDDLENIVLYILKTFPEVRKEWQETLQYILVDEVQDCNREDWELFTTLSGHYRNLFVVGDSDQSIYEWRGADPEMFIHFKADQDIYLKENYRSLPNIVCLSDCIIMHNKKRLPRTSVTMRKGSWRTLHLHCKNEKEEAGTVAGRIGQIHKDGVKWEDFAVLYRASYLSRELEQAFIRANIPYDVWGGIRFFERAEVKIALSYLRLAALDDDIAFRRIANVPSRKLGKQKMARIEGMAKEQDISMFEALRRNIATFGSSAVKSFVETVENARRHMEDLAISDLMDGLLQGSGVLEMYRQDLEEERLENLQELIKSIRQYEVENREEEYSVETYLQDIALYTNADYRKDKYKVKLMTIHQAKGLEFKCVFVYGLNEGVFPSHRTIRERGLDGLEEERRLMYVACTRAKDMLFLTESEGYSVQNSQAKYPSRFIMEARDEMGTLYDTIGDFDPNLWERTKELASLAESSDSLLPEIILKEGDRVIHSHFGEGTVVFQNRALSTTKVVFDRSGKREVRSDTLSRPWNQDRI